MLLPDDTLKAVTSGTIQHGQTIFSDNTESQLLLSVATHALKRRAGYTPPQLTSPDTSSHVAPVDNRPVVSWQAMQHFILMTQERYQTLMGQWLSMVKECNKRVPEEFLPLMLSLGYRQSQHRAVIHAVIGELGVWLAAQAQRNEWHWVLWHDQSNTVAVEKWPVASSTEREAILVHLRQHDPAQGRSLLDSVWFDLSLKERLQYLYVLAINLAADDEAFLDARLQEDDVYDVAARLLSQIPQSRFSQSVIAQVTACFTLIQGFASSTLAIDFDWQSLGSPRYMPLTRLRVEVMGRHWLPHHMLTYVPPRFWCERWQITPEQLIEAGRNSALPERLFDAWTWAVLTTGDDEFAVLLLMLLQPGKDVLTATIQEKLIQLLSASQREEVAIHWLKHIPDDFDESHPANAVLEAHTEVWSVTLMQVFLVTIRRKFKRSNRPLLEVRLRQLIHQYIPYFPLAMKADILDVLQVQRRAEMSETEIEILDEIIATLDFREAMAQAIART